MTSGRVFQGLRLADAEWLVRAECRTEPKDTFFLTPGEYPWEAKRICARCEVRDECLEYAVVNDIEEGIWGGMTPRARRGLRVRR